MTTQIHFHTKVWTHWDHWDITLQLKNGIGKYILRGVMVILSEKIEVTHKGPKAPSEKIEYY